jgi:hypothetical protein
MRFAGRLPLALALALALASALSATASTDAASGPADKAARGLDVFVHAPAEAAPGAALPVDVEALGFPTVVTLAPLAGAALEAGWDPESLGPNAATAPPSVRATADASGRARLLVPVPDGEERALRLLIGVRSGEHARTRSLEVRRVRPHDVGLFVPDPRVVPGGETSAWVMVTSASTGAPVGAVPVELELLEGGALRRAFSLVTDAAGTAMARVPIPRTEEPAWSWTLRARTAAPSQAGGQASLTLTPREETPGTPRLVLDWVEHSVKAGDEARWVVRVRDAVGAPLASLPVRTWIGPRGTKAPDDEKAWEKASTLGRTNAAGELEGVTKAPTLVARGAGTTLELVVRTSVEGHALAGSATLSVGAPTSSAELVPEGGALLPGAPQRLLLRVLDGHGKPVAATFVVEGDGLSATVTTDAHGEAELGWQPPPDVGARRDVGPCAGGVAAAVRVRAKGDVPALGRSEPFELCLSVARDAAGFLRPETPLVRAGDKVRVRVVPSARGRGDARSRKGAQGFTLLAESARGAQAVAGWLDDGERGGEVEVPAGASGLWRLAAASPETRDEAGAPGKPPREPLPSRDKDDDDTLGRAGSPLVGGAVLVVPRVLPRLRGATTGGRAAPGGAVDVDVDLDDGHGKGLPGTVAAVVIDLYGGGSVGGLVNLDTRTNLCRALVAEPERCDEVLEGGAALDPFRRGALAEAGRDPRAPALDPGPGAPAELRKAFASVVRSLEGAVYEASQSADRLADARRRGPGGAWTWNPELMTLVTAAMDPAPVTPGGEPIVLGDLLAIDPQVTFDHVARRVTRLKLFRILDAVRRWRHDRQLDPDEPALRDPNAILRRLVRDGTIAEDLLLDPWGGTIRFGRASGPPAPFLGVLRGFELRAPGPDGVFGNGDDVRDPFERVLATGTPYARAVGEDRIVDAKLDLEVGDATVNAWQALLEELTGTSLGAIGHGSGTGSGSGYGSGHGRLGSSVRMGATSVSEALPSGIAWWSPPARTDDKGHLRLHVPLGDLETTWRVALVGVPDGAPPATSHVDVPVKMPLSARVDAGALWTEGDEVGVAVVVRNGTDKPLRANVEAAAGGVATLVDARGGARTVDVPANGTAEATFRLAAKRAGGASLTVTTRAGELEDRAEHRWDVVAAGERVDKAAVRWVEGEEELSLANVAPLRPNGAPRLVVERGADAALVAVLEALDPDRLATPDAMADAIEVGTRLERWATAQKGERSPVALRAGDVARRAEGRLALAARAEEKARGFGAPAAWAAEARARAWRPPPEAERKAARRSTSGEPASCPPKGAPTLAAGLDGVEAEPPPSGGSVDACWDAYVTDTVGAASAAGEPVALARLVLALAERPHRAALASMLADRLREKAALDAGGGVVLPGAAARDRAARAIVYSALLRAARLGTPPAAPGPDRLAAWLLVQRDSQGGFGSPLATRSAVRALLAWSPADASPARVVVIAGGTRRELALGASASEAVQLDPKVTSVRVEARGAGVMARFELPMLRPWWQPPDDPNAPARIDVTWPDHPKAGATGVVRVAVRHALGRPTTVDVRLPLPPGVSLAAPVANVRQVQGVLAIRAPLDASPLPTTFELPVRFALAGKVTAPEARARLAFEDAPRSIAPARAIVIE